MKHAEVWIGVIVVVTASLSILRWMPSEGGGLRSSPEFLFCAHRGLRTPPHVENTIEAFDAAIRLGANCFELDVAFTKDYDIVVVHPGSFFAAHGRQVSELNLVDLRALNRSVPTFDEVLLRYIPKEITLLADVKASLTGMTRKTREMMVKVIDAKLKGYGSDSVYRLCLVHSNAKVLVDRLIEFNGKIQAGYIFGDYSYTSKDVAEFITSLRTDRINVIALNIKLLDAEVKASITKRNSGWIASWRKMVVILWLVDDEETLRGIDRKFISGIVTHHPEFRSIITPR